MGLGLCPWAVKSERQGRLQIILCNLNEPAQVAEEVKSQAQALCARGLDLETVLLVCPNVVEWQKDYSAFECFLKSMQNQLQETVTLVDFHPQFLKWRGLPLDIGVGSQIMANTGEVFQQGSDFAPATILETHSRMFGRRKIKVRFHNQEGRKDDQAAIRNERYVPIDWCVFSGPDGNTLKGPPLPDNAMHRAPYPTIHLIQNQDLGKLRARDVSRVKRKNAELMMKMGWKGILEVSKSP